MGFDYSSTDNCFKSNANTWKIENKSYTTKTYLCWKYSSIDKLWEKVVEQNRGSKADKFVIMAHSAYNIITLCSNFKRPKYPNNLINSYSDFESIKKFLKANAKIEIHGCNAGGMIEYNSIAQIIANKTKRTTYAYVNYTTQRKNRGFRQVPIDEKGESFITFNYINKRNEEKKRKGRIKKNFTKFSPENDDSIPIC